MRISRYELILITTIEKMFRNETTIDKWMLGQMGVHNAWWVRGLLRDGVIRWTRFYIRLRQTISYKRACVEQCNTTIVMNELLIASLFIVLLAIVNAESVHWRKFSFAREIERGRRGQGNSWEGGGEEGGVGRKEGDSTSFHFHKLQIILKVQFIWKKYQKMRKEI